MPQLNPVPPSDSNVVDRAVEERYTNKFLDGLSEFAWDWDEEFIDPYAIFYSANVEAGYAFHMLKQIFKKIDAFIGIKSSSQSPWKYFSSLESLVSFSKAIETLTKAAQGVNEPLVIEKIRIVDRSDIRRAMLKRITDLEPSRRTFSPEVLDYLTDRNTIFDNFLEAVDKEGLKEEGAKEEGEKKEGPKVIGKIEVTSIL